MLAKKSCNNCRYFQSRMVTGRRVNICRYDNTLNPELLKFQECKTWAKKER